MGNTILFIVEVAAVVALVGAAILGAVYVSRLRERDSPRGSANTGGQAGGEAERRQETPLRFYKTMSHEAEGEIQIDLYSPEEYQELLGGDKGLEKNSEFVAVLKAYKYLEDDWYELQPERAAELLEMDEGDYEADGVRTALLIRKLPPGTPFAARERFTRGA